MEDSGQLILSTGESGNAGSIIMKAGGSELGDHEYQGASIDITVSNINNVSLSVCVCELSDSR